MREPVHFPTSSVNKPKVQETLLQNAHFPKQKPERCDGRAVIATDTGKKTQKQGGGAGGDTHLVSGLWYGMSHWGSRMGQQQRVSPISRAVVALTKYQTQPQAL